MSSVSFAQPDITLHLDDQGVIREASVSGGIPDGAMEAWVGRPWLETVGEAGGDKVRRMIEDASRGDVSAFRHVVQKFPSGREFPIEYTTMRAPGKKGGLLALGKNLQAVAELQSRLIAAQHATEREYWKLRDVETRYRLLFDASNEAVLMIGGEDFRIVEANPTAVRALGLAPGWEFPANLVASEREAFLAMLLRVREQGRAPGIVLHLGSRGEAWGVRASLMASEPGLRYLLHVAPAGGQAVPDQAPVLPPVLPIDDLVEQLPDGFVAITPDGVVLRANAAFLDMIQAGASGAVIGQPLGRWLAQPGADVAVLLANVQRHRAVRSYQTILSGELGDETQVEISASGSGDGASRVYGLMLRDIGRRPIEETPASGSAVSQAVVEQLGRAPLLQVVRTMADAVERQMIAAALARVDGNRTAAAELLGLSRQSLHTKLNRQASEDASHHPAGAV